MEEAILCLFCEKCPVRLNISHDGDVLWKVTSPLRFYSNSSYHPHVDRLGCQSSVHKDRTAQSLSFAIPIARNTWMCSCLLSVLMLSCLGIRPSLDQCPIRTLLHTVCKQDFVKGVGLVTNWAYSVRQGYEVY
jgi:hypothetical protein